MGTWIEKQSSRYKSGANPTLTGTHKWADYARNVSIWKCDKFDKDYSRGRWHRSEDRMGSMGQMRNVCDTEEEEMGMSEEGKEGKAKGGMDHVLFC